MKRFEDHTLKEIQELVKKYYKMKLPFSIEASFESYNPGVLAKITIPNGEYYGSLIEPEQLFDIERALLDLNEKERKKKKDDYDKIAVQTEITDKIINNLLPTGENSNVVDIEY